MTISEKTDGYKTVLSLDGKIVDPYNSHTVMLYCSSEKYNSLSYPINLELTSTDCDISVI